MRLQNMKWTGAALLSVVILGCGHSGPRTPPGETLTLVILNDGQPVTNAHVDLSNSGGGEDLNEKGEAVIKAVPPGEYRVVVYPALPMSAVIPTENPTPAPISKKPVGQPDGGIPKPFRDETTTPFKINVQGGTANRFELDLKKP